MDEVDCMSVYSIYSLEYNKIGDRGAIVIADTIKSMTTNLWVLM